MQGAVFWRRQWRVDLQSLKKSAGGGVELLPFPLIILL
jgi:hypothetical protein